MKESVQVLLRDATHPYHVRLNQHPLIVGLAGQNYDLFSYQTVLIAYFHLYGKLETRINEYAENHSVPFDYSTREKLPWINDDLCFFRLDPQIESNRPALPIMVPKIESIGQLIGMLYPLEGATLGGQVVSKHLQQSLGLTMSQGARFFNGYAENTAARWAEFCQFADLIQHHEQQCTLAVATAKLTFSLFENILDDFHRTHRSGNA